MNAFTRRARRLREWAGRPAGSLRALAKPAAVTRARLVPPRAAERAARAITLLSANLWHDWPRGRRLLARLDAFAELVEREAVDVVLLQEVARSSLVEADRRLADRLGMAFVYARANGHLGAIGFEEGVAVLSRYALDSPRVVALGPGRGRVVKRLALAARVAAGDAAFWAVSAHLGLRRRTNAVQMRALREWVAAELCGGPAVIAGDLNAPEHAPQIRETQRCWLDAYRAVHPGEAAPTFELRAPWGPPLARWRLDYVFLRPEPAGWKVLDARLVDAPGTGHSDHRAVLVRVEAERWCGSAAGRGVRSGVARDGSDRTSRAQDDACP